MGHNNPIQEEKSAYKRGVVAAAPRLGDQLFVEELGAGIEQVRRAEPIAKIY